jgi:hypothetical protein
MDDAILDAIAYLDDDTEKLLARTWTGHETTLTYEAVAALIQALIQVEMSKRGVLQTAGELPSRVALLESQTAALMRTVATRRLPVVEYVVHATRNMPAVIELGKELTPGQVATTSDRDRANRLNRYRVASGVVSLIWLLGGIAAMAARLPVEPFFALFFSTFGLYVVFAMKARGL